MANLELRNISKSFSSKRRNAPETVLSHVSLAVPDGKIFCLLGPSGIGKSTLLKIVCGLLVPEEGDVLFDGESVLRVPVERRGAVLVFQDASLFPHLTVEENISFGLKMRGASRGEQRRVAAEMLSLVEMEECARKLPGEISGGQKQRVALARALAVRPRILLLDEPFSSLDARLRRSMRAFMRALQRKTGITTLLVTHDWEEALQDSDILGLLFDGKLLQTGAPEDVFSNPVSPRAADFFGVRNYFDVEVRDGTLSSPFGSAPANAPDGRYLGMLRPDQIALLPDVGGAGSVLSAEYGGERIYYDIVPSSSANGCGWSRFRVAASLEGRLREGESVSMSARCDTIRLFPAETDRRELRETESSYARDTQSEVEV